MVSLKTHHKGPCLCVHLHVCVQTTDGADRTPYTGGLPSVQLVPCPLTDPTLLRSCSSALLNKALL